MDFPYVFQTIVAELMNMTLCVLAVKYPIDQIADITACCRRAG